jgi:hypothetical protein
MAFTIGQISRAKKGKCVLLGSIQDRVGTIVVGINSNRVFKIVPGHKVELLQFGTVGFTRIKLGEIVDISHFDVSPRMNCFVIELEDPYFVYLELLTQGLTNG